MSPSRQQSANITPVKRLNGKSARYELGELLGDGGSGQTYKATVAELWDETGQDTSPLLMPGAEVAIKIPKLNPDLSLEEKRRKLAKLRESYDREFACMKRFQKLTCVAHILDDGIFPLHLDTSRELPVDVLFIVQEYIPGERLDLFMRSHFSSGDRAVFHGIQDAHSFFTWTRKILERLRLLHQDQILHGDIWYKNIMVSGGDNIVFIDFGQALFRDLALTHDYIVADTNPYRPPEGRGTLVSEIFAVGGLLYYLATGEDPPQTTPDDDELKETIASGVKIANETLYAENSGIVDIISRCRRYSYDRRAHDAETVLQDLETFSPELRINSLTEAPPIIEELDKHGIPLFSWMAKLRVRQARRGFQDMLRGVYDLTGDHEEIVSGWTQFLSILGDGDEYLTVSRPSLWHTINLGINGRFLTMNKLIAERNATVRRVLLVTSSDIEKDRELPKIVESQRRITTEIAKKGIQTTKWQPGHKGYYTGVKMISAEEAEEIRAQRRHFGLLFKAGVGTLAIPEYSPEDVVWAIHFRSAPDLLKGKREYVEYWLEKSTPIQEYSFPEQ